MPRRAALGRRGRSKLGNLLVLLLLVAGAYYGFGAGSAYFRYWRMLEEMRTQARLAPGLEDAVIRRRLVARAEQLGLPPDARRFIIRRRTRPREITITTTWQEPIELPFTVYIYIFRPEVRAQI